MLYKTVFRIEKGYKHKIWEKPAIVDFLIVDYCKRQRKEEKSLNAKKIVTHEFEKDVE
jgi:hypothetical protein